MFFTQSFPTMSVQNLGRVQTYRSAFLVKGFGNEAFKRANSE
jgi:hypothetical protein